MKYKPKHEMQEDDTVAGVVYAAAAEQVIRIAFERAFNEPEGHHEYPKYQPTVIGYMVEVEDVDWLDGWLWPSVDYDRKHYLTNKRHLNDTELKELAAIERRLGKDVTR